MQADIAIYIFVIILWIDSFTVAEHLKVSAVCCSSQDICNSIDENGANRFCILDVSKHAIKDMSDSVKQVRGTIGILTKNKGMDWIIEVMLILIFIDVRNNVVGHRVLASVWLTISEEEDCSIVNRLFLVSLRDHIDSLLERVIDIGGSSMVNSINKLEYFLSFSIWSISKLCQTI